VTLREEIFDQPDVLRNLLRNREAIVQIAAELRRRKISFVYLAARGSSDNAGLYTKYILGGRNGLPVALAAPSLFTIYRTPPQLSGTLVIGISQSGTSTDIVEVLKRGRESGATTLAITNDSSSPLAQTAEFILDIQAGAEEAVAATKTYTAQLLAIALLSVELSNDRDGLQALNHVPSLLTQALELDQEIANLAERYRYIDRCVVLGRGFNYCTAYEWALKLEEMTYVVAEPYSSADFQHGPIAVIEHGFPVFAILPEGLMFEEVFQLSGKLKDERNAELIVLSNRKEALDIATSPIPLPGSIPEWISPIPFIVPAQLFVYHLTVAKGYDTEHPRGLKKVTDTQ
jgi:glucosamine--fructose-6-phosphate aminotransferase (isomerizing)